MFSKITNYSCAIAAIILFAVCVDTPASAQVGPNVLQTATSSDGLLTLVLSSSNPSDTVGVNNTYTWTATNNSRTFSLTGVVLGSHWGDYCIGRSANLGSNCPTAPPVGPTLISLSSGCGAQSPDEFPTEIAVFGIWCTPVTGVTLPPGASVSGSVTLRPGTGGPAFDTVYSGYNDPVTGVFHAITPVITNNNVVAPSATNIQLAGSASTGSPALGSTFSYTYQVKNAGPWGTYGGIIFVDTLAASLTYVSSTVTQSTLDRTTGQAVQFTNSNGCSVVGQAVVCSLNDMYNGTPWGGAVVTLTVTASGAPFQQIVNTASVHTVSPQADSNPANNSVTVNVTTK